MNRRQFLTIYLEPELSSQQDCSLSAFKVPSLCPLLKLRRLLYSRLASIRSFIMWLIFDSCQSPFPPASQSDVALKVDSVISQTASEQQEQFKLVLALIENPSLSTLLSFQTKPFSQSTNQERIRST